MKKIVMLISLSLVLIATPKAVAQTGDELFQKGLQLEEVKGELGKAIDVYKNIISAYAPNKGLVARSLLHLGKCYEKLGKSEARKAYERVVREFADQSELVAEARARLSVLAREAEGDYLKSMTARRIWTGPGVDCYGSPSPDGRYLSFVDWETGGDLGLHEIATGDNRRVTRMVDRFKSEGMALSSVFAPDGNQIAYVWWNNEGKWDLRVIKVDGSSVRILCNSDDVPDVIDWSRDGKYLAATFEKKDGTHQIVLVSPADTSVRIVKSLGSRPIGKMCFSPDGRYLAYDYPPQDSCRQHDIYVLSIDNFREISLVQHPADDVLFGWAPSGKTIFFGSDRRGAMDGWTLKVEEGKPVGDPVLIKRDMGEITPMGFSQNSSFYYGVNTTMRDIYSVTMDSSGKILSSPAKITQRFVGSYFCPAWSSDGKYLAYVSQRLQEIPRGSSALRILAMETGIERDLIVNLELPFNPRWSTDGRSIFLRGSDGKGRTGLFQIDVETGGVTPFLVRPELWLAFIAPNGSALYFNRNGVYYDKGIVKRDLATGQETLLTSGIPYGLTLSPDGNYLAYSVPDRNSVWTIMIVPTSGGPPREITQMNLLGDVDVSLAWTRDGRFLLFTKPKKDGTELWRVSIDGKQSEFLGLAMKSITHLNVRPDGKQLAFDSGEFHQEVWVMENFLPKEDGKKR